MTVQQLNAKPARVVNVPGHLVLLAPWPVPGECEWLGGCPLPATDDGRCEDHGRQMRRAAASAAKAWALMGVDIATAVLP